MKALVVEDDPEIVEFVEDVLFTLDVEHDKASNHQDAKQLLTQMDYDLVLLDLEIPAKANRRITDKQYGINLLKDIQRIKKQSPPPVIMMTDHLAYCLDRSTKLQRLGVREFISKPFSSKGRTLSGVIQSVVESSTPRQQRSKRIAKNTVQGHERFSGGEMVFYADRVTLCDVTVLVNSRAKQMRKILDELRQCTSMGAFVARSGPELVELTNIRGGQNSVSGAIRSFRNRVADILLEQLGVAVGPQDIICSGGLGYRLNEWISVRTVETVDSVEVVVYDSEMDRRERILSELRKGEKLRAPAIAARLGCCAKTVRRELDALRVAGQIEFVGPSKTGHYCIRSLITSQ